VYVFLFSGPASQRRRRCRRDIREESVMEHMFYVKEQQDSEKTIYSIFTAGS